MGVTDHLITREIGIDMGHRVTFHGSKCRNPHGHRYTVQVTCKGPLAVSGEEQGMVIDFGFLKEEMMAHIDAPCDHGFCFWVEDEMMLEMFTPTPEDLAKLYRGDLFITTLAWRRQIKDAIDEEGYFEGFGRGGSKIYVVPFVPTAENLAFHWFHRLRGPIAARTEGRAFIERVKVWETPNCSAEYDGR